MKGKRLLKNALLSVGWDSTERGIKSNANLELERLTQAQSELKRRTPKDSKGILDAASELVSGGEYSEALQILEQISPQMFNMFDDQRKYYVWYLRGNIYQKIGKRTKAVECYRTSLKYSKDKNNLSYDRLRELNEPIA